MRKIILSILLLFPLWANAQYELDVFHYKQVALEYGEEKVVEEEYLPKGVFKLICSSKQIIFIRGDDEVKYRVASITPHFIEGLFYMYDIQGIKGDIYKVYHDKLLEKRYYLISRDGAFYIMFDMY